jgi:hypothetical protein
MCCASLGIRDDEFVMLHSLMQTIFQIVLASADTRDCIDFSYDSICVRSHGRVDPKVFRC